MNSVGSEFWVFEPETNCQTRPNAILEKSFAFSVRILKFRKWLCHNHRDISPLARQILRSATSIGANAEEADSAFTKKEFAAKIGISLKECKETHYWLRLLHAAEYIDEAMFRSLRADADELLRLLTSILKSTRENL